MMFIDNHARLHPVRINHYRLKPSVYRLIAYSELRSEKAIIYRQPESVIRHELRNDDVGI